nr:exodeoxyribonuclease V subunit alpha [Mycolicibacterium palauense]
MALGAGGVLGAFNRAGVLEAADVHVAARITDRAGEPDATVALAVALAVRALRGGSVCVDLTTVRDELASGEVAGEDTAEADDERLRALPWPEPGAWLDALRRSPLLGSPAVLRLYRDRLLYLDRYWREEQQVCADLLGRNVGVAPVDEPVLEDGLRRVFHRPGSEEQRSAARIAVAQNTTVLTGGPGTGKTTTVAGLLALLAEQAELAGRRRPRIALAAPTGKAAARLGEAVHREVEDLGAADRARLAGLQAVTLHRLLGWRPDTSARFRHHRGNHLPHDVIVVDETSMVSLTMMARLLEAVRPECRLLLVGDPDQLTSVDAGAVLADLVDGLGGAGRRGLRVAGLATSHRFGETIGELADAVRTGDGERAIAALDAGGPHIEFVDAPAESAEVTEMMRDILVPKALRLRAAAAGGDPASALATLDHHRLLCAHREGPAGVRHWNRRLEQWLREETGEARWNQWYLGRPVLVTANDYGLGLYNGDAGVTVRGDGGELRVVIAGADGVRDFATSRLAEVETMHAMTIHKSQGSQADEVTVLLPPRESRLASRELFYTALTRARSKVRVVGSRDEVRAALARRAVRATGLRYRLAEEVGAAPRPGLPST